MIRKRVLQRFKQGLTVVGERVPGRALLNMQITLNYLMLGNWMRENGFGDTNRLADREALFDLVAERIKDKRTLYLEFGVYQGRSMRYWSNALKHDDAILHGFDSFQGLPEEFDRRFGFTKHSLDVGGAIPSIDDPRVSFFKGWFEDVLPTYDVPDHDQLLITLDADLYSSTIYVLRRLREYIKPGSYLYFDDMSQPLHEPRAFEEYIAESGQKFRVLAADVSLNCVVFECVESDAAGQ